ncbi:MAG: hypothetical protein AAGJ08_06090 [Cyanobacteria bacterium P01_H01_bin.35]
MTKKIIQIIPRLPLYGDGVADYSVKLSETLLQQFGISTEFMIFEPEGEIRELNNFHIQRLPAHNPDTLISLLPQRTKTVILQYSNYPYLKSKLKAPFWLLKALQLAMNSYQIKLIVMFHELPILKYNSINVLNPIQSILSYQLAKLADVTITNNAKIQSTLSQWLNKPVTSIPNFSTIGEPNCIRPLKERKYRIVVFGTTHNRSRIYGKYFNLLLLTCKKLGIREIYDIGQTININRDRLSGIHLVQMGKQPPEVVSDILLSSTLGFLDYSWYPGCLGKSTVFAAFSAHGLVTILTKYNPSERDGIYLNKHYLLAEDSLNIMNLEELQLIANNARQWYSGHNLISNARIFASYLDFRKKIN